ncbi:MAG: acyl-ACP--UDP-N-acetylglucosamine O-acyltransferase [Planctomycetaceae bacterium]|nr:acyl-ACP--UDP-N-acetylglucosamine O-acyltransferase [Planctomycetaceae bacterium]
MISPISVVSSDAQIGSNVEIGPFCVIEGGVVIGSGCKLDSHVVLKSGVTIGENNQFYAGTVLGGPPQHATALPPFGKIRIGDGNVFRENTTVHLSLKESGTTLIGNDNYVMVGAHVGHDCVIGNGNILVNNVMLGGHVVVGNRAMIGGGSAVHQNCRIGSLVMIGGQARVVQDVPPFFTVDGLTGKIVGLNLIGLRRSGRTSEDLKMMKGAYFTLYRSGMTWKEILQYFQDNYSTGPVAELTQFLLTTKRGIVRERATSRSQLRVVEEDESGVERSDAPATLRVNVG